MLEIAVDKLSAGADAGVDRRRIEGMAARPAPITTRNIRLFAGVLLMLPLSAAVFSLHRNSKLPYSNPLYARRII